jgi:bla regulator protein blaR1
VNPAYLSPLANHLWQSSLFAGIAGVLTLALGNNRARVRHWVWLVASWKFLIPFSVLILLGGQIHWRTAPRTTQSNWSVVMDEVSQPFTVQSPSSVPASAAGPADSLVPALLWTIWACGFLGISSSWWIRWRNIRAAVRAGSPLHLEAPIRVVSSPTPLEPGVFGVFRPVMLLPEGILNQLTPAQLKGVIAHELCHVYHRDNLIAAIHMFVETVFWFHPLVWWIGKRMVDERERACDEEVLQLGNEPRVYAEGILNICKLYVESPLVCAAGVTGANLKRRIEAIITNRTGRRLNRAKKLLLASAGIAALAGPIVTGVSYTPAMRAQTPQAEAPRKFEAATIKPSRPDRQGSGLNLFPGRIRVVNSSLKFCIETAWNLRDFQVSGATGWIAAERYDIEAVAGSPFKKGEYRTMLQALLVDRFGLVIHREKQDKEGFALVIGRSNPKLPPPAEDPDIMFSRTPSGDRTLKAKSATLQQLAEALSSTLGAPVVDRTGIEGQFDLSLQWTPDPESSPRTLKSGEPAPPPPPDALSGPSLFTALQQTLGLKLERQKAPVEVVVIDHASRPSEN